MARGYIIIIIIAGYRLWLRDRMLKYCIVYSLPERRLYLIVNYNL